VAEREDKRLDDLVTQVNHGFARVDGEIAAMRVEIRDTRVELRAEMQDGFARVDAQIARVDGEIGALRTEIGDTRVELRAEMQDGFARVDKQFERVDKQFERIHRWAVALAVATLGILGTNLVQGFGG
jgi:hypothetical protein